MGRCDGTLFARNEGRVDCAACTESGEGVTADNQNLHREFLARCIYNGKAAKDGVVPCYWDVLRDDLKDEFRLLSDKGVAQWLELEECARKARDVEHNPRAYFFG